MMTHAQCNTLMEATNEATFIVAKARRGFYE